MLRYTERVRSETCPDFVWSAMLRLTTILKDGGTLEYVFEAGEKHSPDAGLRDTNGKWIASLDR